MFDLFDNTESAVTQYGFVVTAALQRKLQYYVDKQNIYFDLKGVHITNIHNVNLVLVNLNNTKILSVDKLIEDLTIALKITDYIYYKEQNKKIDLFTNDKFNIKEVSFKNRTWIL